MIPPLFYLGLQTRSRTRRSTVVNLITLYVFLFSMQVRAKRDLDLMDHKVLPWISSETRLRFRTTTCHSSGSYYVLFALTD